MNDPQHPSLAALLESGAFITSAELTPPRHFQLDGFMAKARAVAPFVDIVQVNDNLLSQARCSSVVCAGRLAAAGYEVVMQFGLRHKNRIALQSDLLGLAASGVRNVVVLGGYPCAIGSDPDAKDATDITSIDAVSRIRDLAAEGRLFNGDQIAPAPEFFPGTIDWPCPKSQLDESLAKLEAKVRAGARFIQIQAVFEVEPMAWWMGEITKRGFHNETHFIAAIFPFSGAERLETLKGIPGLSVPDRLLARIRASDSRDEALRISVELVGGIRAIDGFSGLHLRSISAEDWVGPILEAAGLAGSRAELASVPHL